MPGYGFGFGHDQVQRKLGLKPGGYGKSLQKQQIAVVDDIAYLPDDPEEIPEPPVAFFHLLRQLVVWGYFTSKEGLEDLGYTGNRPNLWDGPPQDVLQKHGITGEEAWLAKCVDHNTRGEIAEWDEKGNLLN